MADVIRERETTGSSVLTWIALVLSIAALLMAVAAYNRTGESIDERVRRLIDSSNQEVQQRTDNIGNEVQNGVENIENSL